MSKIITDWHELDLQSMDIILCAGNSKMSGRIEKFQRFTGAPKSEAKITHVAGLQWVNHDNTPTDRWLAVQESTTLNKWSGKSGVQRSGFERWLACYDGEVFLKQLDFIRTGQFYRAEMVFWQEHQFDKYENGIPGYLELLLCGMRLHRYVRKIPCMAYYTPKFTTEPHCTELNAKRILAHDLWSRPIAINRMPPYIWQSIIDNWLKVPIGPMVLIKD